MGAPAKRLADAPTSPTSPPRRPAGGWADRCPRHRETANGSTGLLWPPRRPAGASIRRPAPRRFPWAPSSPPSAVPFCPPCRVRVAAAPAPGSRRLAVPATACPPTGLPPSQDAPHLAPRHPAERPHGAPAVPTRPRPPCYDASRTARPPSPCRDLPRTARPPCCDLPRTALPLPTPRGLRGQARPCPSLRHPAPSPLLPRGLPRPTPCPPSPTGLRHPAPPHPVLDGLRHCASTRPVLDDGRHHVPPRPVPRDPRQHAPPWHSLCGLHRPGRPPAMPGGLSRTPRFRLAPRGPLAPARPASTWRLRRTVLRLLRAFAHPAPDPRHQAYSVSQRQRGPGRRHLGLWKPPDGRAPGAGRRPYRRMSGVAAPDGGGARPLGRADAPLS